MSPWRMVVRKPGGLDAIEREEFTPPAPAPDEIVIETEAVGLNFIDIYYRTGLYPAEPPFTLGSESVGKVIAVGDAVQGFAVGDRAGTTLGTGAYATHRAIAAAKAVRIPEDIASEDAAAMLLKGMTACYLAEDSIDLNPGDWALVHAAAGGVGSVLVPWLMDKGVHVIAHVGSPEKAAGVAATHVLSCPMGELAATVRALVPTGVRVSYDGVGKASWDASLASLARRGLLVSFGNASGPVPPVSLLDLSRNGSLYVTRPTLGDYTATPEMLAHTSERVFDRMRRGVIAAKIGKRMALAEAAEAQRALEARETVGATVLVP